MFKLLFVIIFGFISADLIGYNRLGNSVQRHNLAQASINDYFQNQIQFWMENSLDAGKLQMAKRFEKFMIVRNRRKWTDEK